MLLFKQELKPLRVYQRNIRPDQLCMASSMQRDYLLFVIFINDLPKAISEHCVSLLRSYVVLATM